MLVEILADEFTLVVVLVESVFAMLELVTAKLVVDVEVLDTLPVEAVVVEMMVVVVLTERASTEPAVSRRINGLPEV